MDTEISPTLNLKCTTPGIHNCDEAKIDFKNTLPLRPD